MPDDSPPDALDWTPSMALDAAQTACQDTDPDACLVVFLWNAERRYDTRFLQSGMSLSECVALLEIQKARLIRIMEEGASDNVG